MGARVGEFKKKKQRKGCLDKRAAAEVNFIIRVFVNTCLSSPLTTISSLLPLLLLQIHSCVGQTVGKTRFLYEFVVAATRLISRSCAQIFVGHANSNNNNKNCRRPQCGTMWSALILFAVCCCVVCLFCGLLRVIVNQATRSRLAFAATEPAATTTTFECATRRNHCLRS